MTSNKDLIIAALPGYDIGEEIGRGGFGVVLGGTHRALQRRVAIKQIPPQFADDDQIRRRFIDEARLMATIDHPHVVPVYDYVEHGDLCLLVMEYLNGGTVEGRFQKVGFDAASAIAVALACAAGLSASHRRGVLHRDVKPANLLFAADGVVKLTDFGIAKIVGGGDTLVTRAGEIIGTPAYIAPEQARGEDLSPATDVYALATMLYQLLSGVLPFPPNDDGIATLIMHATKQPRPLQDAAPAVPDPIADVVMRGLTTDPADRIDSAESFGIELAAVAAESWGTGWLVPVGIPVFGADTITAAATGNHSDRLGVPRSASPTERIPRRAAPTLVLPAEPQPRRGVGLIDVGRQDVTPVKRVVAFRSPALPLAFCLVLAIAAVAIAWIGIGAPPRGGDLRPGTVTIAGVDPTSTDNVAIDMTKPIPLTVRGVDGDGAALSLDVLGVSVGRHDSALSPSGQDLTATVPPPINPYLLAGRTTAELIIRNGPQTTAVYRFGIRTTQRATTTAVAGITVLLAPFAGAYAESFVRALRRGRSRITGYIGLPLSAAGLSVAAVAAFWVLLGREPTVNTIFGSAVFAAAAGIAATVGTSRVGRKHRYRRSR